ncbi:MAG: flagellar hook-basal body complex protein [Pseudomonadota bacterium]
MGIYGALTTAVTGLQAQSFALENISGNIANSQTTAFKRTDTSFVDYVVENSPKRQKSGIVSAFSRQTNDVQGDILASSTSTSMAINGDGFFQVEKLFDFSDAQPVFNGENFYTRRGDFQVDRFGYLVNGGGFYLKGLPVDRISGNVSGTVPEVIKIPNDFLGAKQTSEVSIRANVPADPRTVFSGQSGGDEFIADALNGADAIQFGDMDDFLESSIAGGAITVFNENGAPINVQMRWAQLDPAISAPPTAGQTQWVAYYQELNPDDAGAATDVIWRALPNNGGGGPGTREVFTFDVNGSLNTDDTYTAGGPNYIDMATLTVDGQTIPNMRFNFGETGLTSYADPSGAYQATELEQNGYPAGELVDVEISDLNRIRANYSNGISIDVAEIPLVSFNSENNLRALDGGGYAKTNESGNPIQGANASIIGASLEASNTDIADEFSKLIVTQQAYSANTRIVSSADEMMQETLNMKR